MSRAGGGFDLTKMLATEDWFRYIYKLLYNLIMINFY